MTATQEAPPLTPDITVAPVMKRPSKRLPFPLVYWQTAVGKKWIMALTGAALMGFVFFHAAGNLKMYMGEEDFNHYAEFLRDLLYPILPHTVALWLLRIGLIVAFGLHIAAAASLTRMNQKARPVRYQSRRDYLAANYASRTMRVSGIIVGLFLLFHLADLTWGVGFINSEFERGEAFANVTYSLDRIGVAAIYIVANIALGIHLFHGAWSMFQSLGVNNPRYNGARRAFAAGFAVLVAGMNISFPIAVLTGVVG